MKTKGIRTQKRGNSLHTKIFNQFLKETQEDLFIQKLTKTEQQILLNKLISENKTEKATSLAATVFCMQNKKQIYTMFDFDDNFLNYIYSLLKNCFWTEKLGISPGRKEILEIYKQTEKTDFPKELLEIVNNNVPYKFETLADGCYMQHFKMFLKQHLTKKQNFKEINSEQLLKEFVDKQTLQIEKTEKILAKKIADKINVSEFVSENTCKQKLVHSFNWPTIELSEKEKELVVKHITYVINDSQTVESAVLYIVGKVLNERNKTEFLFNDSLR